MCGQSRHPESGEREARLWRRSGGRQRMQNWLQARQRGPGGGVGKDVGEGGQDSTSSGARLAQVDSSSANFPVL